ncbi:EscU/YscU/HrcU family type III secretion system export apparatus switch protein [Senegalia massiliensis]|uniref:Flagellar biosynthesis n=1 Tax=Senegalia massiliensis TaxID=1720316 RepID=A0A845QVA1_9CLOT|nr:EscU/YscU/HrcU family type III secretion system export apparatus switch protein [Senegalia massiliensis]NBI06837.1 flagellar biosynthesis [Senegalia massiliensis]
MKKRNVAIAIRYRADIDKVPRIIAKGKGVVATNIISQAEKSDIYINKDDNLANKLYNLEIGSEIPVDFYEAIASILVFVYEIDEKKGKNEKT